MKVFEDVIREGVRAYNFEGQAGDLVGLAVDRILDKLPGALGKDS